MVRYTLLKVVQSKKFPVSENVSVSVSVSVSISGRCMRKFKYKCEL